MAVTAAWSQTDVALYNDGTEAGSVIIGAQNVGQTLQLDTTYLARIGILNGATGSIALGPKWQASLNDNTFTSGLLTFSTVGTVAKIVDSANITDSVDCTQRITVGSFHADNDGCTEDGSCTSKTYLQDERLETLVPFQLLSSGGLVPGDVIYMRCVTAVNVAFSTYVNLVTITVGTPATGLDNLPLLGVS